MNNNACTFPDIQEYENETFKKVPYFSLTFPRKVLKLIQKAFFNFYNKKHFPFGTFPTFPETFQVFP